MRFCIMTETYCPVAGGGESQARELARGLVRQGHSVLVVTRRSSAAFPRLESLDGATVKRISPTGPGRRKKWGLILSGFWTLLKARGEYDTVIVCGFRILGIPAVLATRALNKACILKADSLGEMSGDYFFPGLKEAGLTPISPLFDIFLRARNRLFKRAERFVAISQVIVHELLDAGVDPDRVRVIPNSVDVQRFVTVTEAQKREIRKTLGLPENRLIAVFTGRLVSYKGLKALLRVWRDLATEGEAALLLLVGGGGLDMHNCEAELRSFVKENHLGEAVSFAGEVPKVEAYLQASDLFVFPSENEAFGISVIEAMAVGLPVVSSDSGGLAGIVEDGRTGLSFPCGDEDSLRERIERLLRDPGLRESLGRAARESAVSDYSSEGVVEAYASLVREGIRE